MLLSEYIKKCQSFLEEHGDLECVYSADDEGNAFHKVNYAATLMFSRNPNEYYIEAIGANDEEAIKEYEEDGVELTKICVIN